MGTAAQTKQSDAMARSFETSLEAFDWPGLLKHLDTYGWAIFENLLTSAECERIAGLYDEDRHFRSHVVMARHGFGRGEYKYFYPLPELVARLRLRFIHGSHPSPTAGTSRWGAKCATRTHMQRSSSVVTKLGRHDRRRFCCDTRRTITTHCIRICTASMSFHCKWQYLCPSPKRISPAASSSWSSSGHACSRGPR